MHLPSGLNASGSAYVMGLDGLLVSDAGDHLLRRLRPPGPLRQPGAGAGGRRRGVARFLRIPGGVTAFLAAAVTWVEQTSAGVQGTTAELAAGRRERRDHDRSFRTASSCCFVCRFCPSVSIGRSTARAPKVRRFPHRSCARRAPLGGRPARFRDRSTDGRPRRTEPRLSGPGHRERNDCDGDAAGRGRALRHARIRVVTLIAACGRSDWPCVGSPPSRSGARPSRRAPRPRTAC